MNTQALRVGLSGGIGSGKSTVSALLAQHGAHIIDADQIARSVTASGGAAIAALREAFGVASIDSTGALDRAYMRELAFTQPQARRQLEAIIHPLVGQLTEQQTQTALAQGARVLVFDVPLLVESGRWLQQVDQVLIVDCDAETQIERVMSRNGLAREAVEKILQSQASRAQRAACADLIIANGQGQTLAQLSEHVKTIAQRFGL